MGSTNQPIMRFVEGDQEPDSIFMFEDTDLSAFSTIELRIRRNDCDLLVKTAIVDDAENGVFHFAWGAGDLIEGRHEADLVFVDLAGKEETWSDREPILLIVRGRV